MKVICYTSFTFAYLNRARVLFQSVRRFHPDWHLVALITDRPPPGFALSLADEPFDEIVNYDELGIEDVEAWLFKHDVVEVCTAVKGPFLHQACSRGYDAAIYLDPDTCLFNDLNPLLELLEAHDVVLTPHQLTPDEHRTAVIDNEITSLKTGIYNLGFVAIRTTGEGARMAKWWNDRLLSFCYDDIPNGLFVDQRWCDHVPGLFDKVKILRDPGYNVASWNLSQREVSIERDGVIRVNGSPLRFWHFTKLGPLGDTMTKKYAKDNFPVYELWNWYRGQIAEATSPEIPSRYWAFDKFDDGVQIDKEWRLLYRHRQDLRDAFRNPFAIGPDTYRAWLEHERLLEIA
ncbi:MAG: hypothetical protein JF570_08135 [Caulobacter sp.]|nr:hypothetical protein [Caulobacter sp.]MBW8891056.1 hypothetical protein [Burkholderiales bacterium]